jgi:glycosyltransferase involved in cell wall biosynthesis
LYGKEALLANETAGILFFKKDYTGRVARLGNNQFVNSGIILGMRIGINASFLRKSGTGIGQVAVHVLRTLILHTQYLLPESCEFYLYCEEEPVLPFPLPKNFHVRVFLPFWKRDDVLRKILWEKRLAYMAKKDHCDMFLSLYQAGTIMPENIRHTMLVHDIIPKLYPEYRGNVRQQIHWQRVEQGIRMADHIVAISENTKNDLVSELGITEEKITVVYLDVDSQFHKSISPETVATVLKKYNLQSGYIYHGGGLEIRKNTETLLRAYKQLLVKSQPASNRGNLSTRGGQSTDKEIPKLVISGKIFDRRNKLATDVVGLVQELQLQDHVKLLGFVPDEDLPALYSGALFFVYPSLYEGFGLPVLEALCMHVPVLCSNTSSLPEVGGKAAIYIDPKNTEEMAKQMELLIKDELLRASLISQSSLQAVQFSWEQFVQKVFNRVIR